MSAMVIVEATRLADLESVIERAAPTFREVGEALREIRDARLYRATHSTFEAYCRERWGFTRGRADQLINAVNLDTAVSNEWQARRLRSVQPIEYVDGEPAEATAASDVARAAITAINAVGALDVRAIVDSMSVPQNRRMRAACKRARHVLDALDIPLLERLS